PTRRSSVLCQYGHQANRRADAKNGQTAATRPCPPDAPPAHCRSGHKPPGCPYPAPALPAMPAITPATVSPAETPANGTTAIPTRAQPYRQPSSRPPAEYRPPPVRIRSPTCPAGPAATPAGAPVIRHRQYASASDVVSYFRLPVQLAALGAEFGGFFLQRLPGFLSGLRSGNIAHFLRDFHGAEFRPAHRTEMRQFMAFFRQGFVVVSAGGIRVEGQIKLILPTEFEPRLRHGIVVQLRRRMAFG